MAIMSSLKYFLVSFVVILLSENLFCNGEPGLYLQPYKAPTPSGRCKKETQIYNHQQPASYQGPQVSFPVVTSGVQPLSTYHGNYQPVANTVQQPMAYRLQPIQQGFYAKPITSSTGFVQPQQQVQYFQTKPAQQVEYAQPAQQVQYTQPAQQVQYTQPAQQVQYIQPAQQAQYTQPDQQVEYVQPLNSGVVKPVKPQKLFIKKQNVPHAAQSKPKTQIETSNAQPVKYTIPASLFSQQIPSPAYYSAPAPSLPQTYSIPQTSFTTYAQRYVIPEVSYPIPETSYPQGYPIPESSYPQGYPVPETSYPQGYSVPETSYPQGYPVPETSYPQGYPVPEASYPQGYTVQEISYPQGYPVPETSYPQGYPANNAYTEMIEGPNYIETSPKYLLQNSHSRMYPYGNLNVRIYPKNYINEEIFKMPNTVDTPAGKIDVELIDVMPYKPGTEPIRKVPRVDSIEAIIKPKKTTLEEDIEIDENNSIEPTTTTRSSLSLFG